MVKVNTNGEGLGLVFPQEYKAILMEWLLGDPTRSVKSREAWDYVNEQMAPKTVSRASVINFLNDEGVGDGYLGYKEVTGKGGYHRVYYPLMNTDEFWLFVSVEINKKLSPFLKGQD